MDRCTGSEAVEIAPARPEEWESAFRLVFQSCSPLVQRTRVQSALQLLGEGALDPEGLFVARRDNQLLGALVCMRVPGATGLVWPPQARAGSAQIDVEDRLTRQASTWLRQQGVRLGQALLTEQERTQGQALERGGFRYLTRLWYLHHCQRLPNPSAGAPPRLTIHPYRPEVYERFHTTLLRTYEGTLDFPEISGVRTLEQILEGHRSEGRFEPEFWWLACDGDRPVGVLLATPLDTGTWDVAYTGIVPEARRRGLGRELLLSALRSAHAQGVTEVQLAVDERNQPAWNLYRRLGFEPFDQRHVFLAIWPS